jgi:hypothetical protein
VPEKEKMQDAKLLSMKGIMLDMQHESFRDDCGSVKCMYEQSLPEGLTADEGPSRTEF